MRKFHYIISLSILLVLLNQCKPTEEKNLLIQNATIIDGTGADRFVGSLRIKGSLIIDIGDLTVFDTDSIIDGTGMILNPGFIDTHSHHDGDTLRTVEAAISQGITTIIVGQDGFSRPSLSNYFDSLKTSPLSLNIASYVGHNTVRQKVMGNDFKREATIDEIEAMKKLIARDMQSGALGLSTGLEYDPGIYSNTQEVIEMAKVASQYGGRYISHMRSEDMYLEQSIDEILRVGKETNMPVQISHFKLARKGLWGKAAKILTILDSARSDGIDVTADIYPYQYWQSTMTVLFPKRDFDNRESAAFALSELTTPEGVIVNKFNANPIYEGLTLKEIADLRKEDAVTTFITLIKMSQETPGESIIAKSMDLEDIKTLSRWPHINLCSDGAPSGHPRGWGAFPRYLNMDTGESLETKIHKMTTQAAENMGIDSIGIIKEGYYADLLLFGIESFKDKATFKESTLKAEGLHKVIVSGKVVFQNKAPTMIYSGRVLKN